MARAAPTRNASDADVAHRLLKRDRRLRLLSKQILREQDRLRRQLSVEGWNIYLRLEELTEARYSELLDRLRARLRR